MTEVELRRLYVARATREFPTTRFFIENVGTAMIGESRVRFGIKGKPDISAITRPNLLSYIELKNIRTPHTKEQQAWQAWCVSWGIPYLLLRAQSDDPIEEWIMRTREFLEGVGR